MLGGAIPVPVPVPGMAGRRQQNGLPADADSARAAQRNANQAKLVLKAEDLMQDRPLHGGTVTRVTSDGIEVRFHDAEGKVTKDTFPPREVFFFRESGDLATAANAPKDIQVGDRVMVPEPEQQPRDAVAGTREDTENVTPAATKPQAASKRATKKVSTRRKRR